MCRAQLENLAVLVEQQRRSSLRERAAFLVLTRTLLLGLGELSETQHLLTAQRVYALLERPLLEVVRSDASQVGRPLTSINPKLNRARTEYRRRRVLMDGVGSEQEAERPVSVPTSYSEAAALYLSRCAQGQQPDAEYGFVLVALLRDFISCLKCHDASFKGKISQSRRELR